MKRIRIRKEPERKIRIRANDWTPALHPRDPDTGKFVERPYSVPDDIASMDTRDVVNELAAMNPDFEQMAQDVAVDVPNDDGGGSTPQRIQDLIQSAQAGGGGSGRFDVGDEITVDTERQGEVSGSVVEHNPEFDELILETDDGETVYIPEDEITSMPGTPGGSNDNPFARFDGDEFTVNAWSASLGQTALNRMVYDEGMEERYESIRDKLSELQGPGNWSDGSATMKLTDTEKNRVEEALREYKESVDRVVDRGMEETLMLRNPERTQRRVQTAITEFNRA